MYMYNLETLIWVILCVTNYNNRVILSITYLNLQGNSTCNISKLMWYVQPTYTNRVVIRVT